MNTLTIDDDSGAIFHLQRSVLCVNLKEMASVGVKRITFPRRSPWDAGLGDSR